MKQQLKLQWLITGLAAVAVVATYATGLSSNIGNPPPKPPAEAKVYPTVTGIKPVSGTFESRIQSYGSTAPVQSLNLAAEVSGKVVAISPAFKSGERLDQNAVILRIDDHQYREAVASAKSTLAAANVTLLQQQLNQTQAKAEWKRSGLSGAPDSRLALYEPQVKAAEAAVEHARSALAKAEADLSKTVIRTPFNALVISRSIELGSYVQAGSSLALLYGTDQLELSIPLAAKDWSNLPQPDQLTQDWLISLTDTESNQHWTGYVDRVAQHIDSNTRQRSLIVRIDNPLDLDPPLYPGTFIEAQIPGNRLADVWQIPVSAVTPNNEIWLIDNRNMLTRMAADVRLRMEDRAYITPEKNLQQPLIVAMPLGSYLPGMKVDPIVEPGIRTNKIGELSQIEKTQLTSPEFDNAEEASAQVVNP